jgi:hypothetical protein
MPFCTFSARHRSKYNRVHSITACSQPTRARSSSIVRGIPGGGVGHAVYVEDFKRDVAREHLHELTAEERLAGLPAEQFEA